MMRRLILLLLFSFYSMNSNAEEASFEFTHKEINEVFSTLLKKRGINYRIDESGRIYYDIMDTEAIKKAQIDAVSIDLPANRSKSYSKEKVLKAFTEVLDSNKVPYVVKKRHDNLWVVWDEGHDEHIKNATDAAERKLDELIQQFMHSYKKSSNND